VTLDLRKFFTREAIVSSLASLPELQSPVMDLMYPPSARIAHPFPVIGYQDLGLPQGNIPVVRRGAASYALRPAAGGIDIIEPQPVNPSIFIDAAMMNNLAMLQPAGQQQLVNNKIDVLRRACRMTAEALAAQSVTGKIEYPMSTEGPGFLDYTVDWGTPDTVTIADKWDGQNITIAKIIAGIGLIMGKMKKNGYGSQIEFWVGLDVFAALIEEIGGLNNSALAIFGPDSITLAGGLKFRLMPASYTDLATGSAVSTIPAKYVVAIDLAAGHKLFYAALDDLDANLQALPFFAKPIKTDDPSGYKIIGASKPLPVPNVRAIVKASVLT
jgi:hypothetical protein